MTAYQQFMPQGWNDIRKDPIKLLLAQLPTEVELRTHVWREAITDGSNAMLQCVKVPTSKEQKVLGCSGKGGFSLDSQMQLDCQ